MTIRIALYSHDSVGLGHVRRNRALAHAFARELPALTGEAVTGLLVTGQPSAAVDPLPRGWDWLALPGLEPGTDGYAPRHLGVPMTQLIELRASVIEAAAAEFAPDLFIVDRHPFGVGGELRATLHRLRDSRPAAKVVLGLREVLDTPAAALREWRELGGARAVREHFDAVWVYGDPMVHDPRASGELPRKVACVATPTGYLGRGRPSSGLVPYDEPFVLTTVGGGSDGGPLVLAAASAPVPAGYRHLVVAGPQMPAADVDRARAVAGPTTEVVETVLDVQGLLARADAVISMAGYNTICELLVTSTPALVVPRDRRRHEQRIRAEALARRGLVDVGDPATLTSEALGAWLGDAVGRRTGRDGVDLDGLSTSVRLAADLLGRGRPVAVDSASEIAHVG